MNKLKARFAYLLSFAVASTPFVAGALVGVNEPIVPCGRGSDVCTACDLYVLARNIITFLLVLASPLAVMGLVVGGYLIVASAGNEGQVSRGKTIIYYAVWGFIVAFSAWLIVDTIMSQLVRPGVLRGPWNEFPTCNL